MLSSTIILSQLPFENWYDLFADKTYADAIIRRLVAHSYRLEMNGRDMTGHYNSIVVIHSVWSGTLFRCCGTGVPIFRNMQMLTFSLIKNKKAHFFRGKMGNIKTQNKKVYFEMMRVMACALVIFNHLPGYMLYSISKGGKQFFYMCLAMGTRINVPLFFMISGALLLSRNEEWTSVFKKRFTRIVILLLIFDFILMLLNKLVNMTNEVEYEFSLSKYVHGFLENKIDWAGAYWYLYSYLGILFLLPLLQRVAKGITKNEIIALLTLHFITSSFFPLININMTKMQLPTFTFCADFSVPFAYEEAFFYPILGYYLDNRIDIYKVKAKHLCSLIIAGVIGILLSDWCTYNDAILNGQYSQGYVQLFDYLTTIVAFVLIKYVFVVRKPSLNEGIVSKVICFIGSLTLGIYMIDPCLKMLLYAKYESYAEPKLPTLIVSVGWIIISMTFGSLITFVLKKIPGIKCII